MVDMKSLQEKLALIRYQQKKQRYKREAPKAELYWQEQLKGMSYNAIAEKYGVTRTAVRRGCMRYIERKGKYG